MHGDTHQWISYHINSLRLHTLGQRKNGCHFPDDIFKWIFLNENVWILIKISLNFGPKGPINNIPALVQIMAWRRPGAKTLSEPMMVSLLMHICVILPQWVMIIIHNQRSCSTLVEHLAIIWTNVDNFTYCQNWNLKISFQWNFSQKAFFFILFKKIYLKCCLWNGNFFLIQA